MKNKKLQCGIYEIRNTVTGQRYIGSSATMQRRMNAHIKMLEKNTHHSIKLQRAYNKYGRASFTFNVLVIVDQDEKLQTEQRLLDICAEHGENLYNIAICAKSSPMGLVRSPKQCKQISDRLIGNKYAVGYKHTEETKQIMSDTHKGNQYNKGRIYTQEYRDNMSKIKKGKPNGLLGKTHSPETKLKMSESHKLRRSKIKEA